MGCGKSTLLKTFSMPLEELKKATSVKLNIVTDHIALELAEAMKEKFAIPYIYFGKAMDLEIIRKLYEVIEETLNIKVLEALASKEEEYNISRWCNFKDAT